MSLYDAIYVRRSVRSYRKDPLLDGVMEKIKGKLDGLTQLNGYRAKFEIVPGKKAPFALLSYCEDSLGDYINVGYCLQEMDLYIQSLGLGSLWYGTKNPTENGKDGHCITLAFGKTDVPFRKNEEEFKRLGVNEISNADNVIARAVRLAPSARNMQPWKLTFEDGSVQIEYQGRGGLFKGMMKKKLNKIDIGIATKIAEVTLLRYGEKIEFISIVGDDKAFGTRIKY